MLNTFNILRARWQEVLLIVGLQAAGTFAFMEAMQSGSSNNSSAAEIVPFAALLFVTFSVMAKMLSIGFARTSFTDGPLHYEPWALLKIGYHYFWRIIGFELLIGLITVSVALGLYMAAMLGKSDIDKIPKEQINMTMLYCITGGILLMAKPMLFGPATIMVTNCGVFSAFGWLSWMRLFRATKLLAAYILWVAAALTPSFIAQYGGQAFVENYAVMAAFSIAAGLLTLVIYVTAVKAVADVYVQTQHEESEGLPESETGTPENHGENK